MSSPFSRFCESCFHISIKTNGGFLPAHILPGRKPPLICPSIAGGVRGGPPPLALPRRYRKSWYAPAMNAGSIPPGSCSRPVPWRGPPPFSPGPVPAWCPLAFLPGVRRPAPALGGRKPPFPLARVGTFPAPRQLAGRVPPSACFVCPPRAVLWRQSPCRGSPVLRAAGGGRRWPRLARGRILCWGAAPPGRQAALPPPGPGQCPRA